MHKLNLISLPLHQWQFDAKNNSSPCILCSSQPDAGLELSLWYTFFTFLLFYQSLKIFPELELIHKRGCLCIYLSRPSLQKLKSCWGKWLIYSQGCQRQHTPPSCQLSLMLGERCWLFVLLTRTWAQYRKKWIRFGGQSICFFMSLTFTDHFFFCVSNPVD